MPLLLLLSITMMDDVLSGLVLSAALLFPAKLVLPAAFVLPAALVFPAALVLPAPHLSGIKIDEKSVPHLLA